MQIESRVATSPELDAASGNLTCARLLARNAGEWGNEIAFREKELGIWVEYNWAQVYDETERVALGLERLGLGAGDVVAYIGENKAKFVFGIFAVQSLGAINLGVYKDSMKEEIEYLLSYTDARAVIAEDEEQVDKILSIPGGAPYLKHIVYLDPRGMSKYHDERLIAYDSLVEMGAAVRRGTPGRFAELIEAADPMAPAFLATTSGTTSNPKCAVIRNGAFLAHCAAMLELDPKDHRDEYVSVLPLPWIGEIINTVGYALLVRLKVNFAENVETLENDTREIGPTVVLYPPQTWEATVAKIRANILGSTPLKQRLYSFGIARGMAAREEGRRSRICEFLVGRPLRDRIGMSRMRSALTGGAPIGPDLAKFLHVIGIPLRQVYGQTELMGIYCGHKIDDIDLDTVGKPMAGVDVRIDDADENGVGLILTRHSHMFSGYYNNPEATAEALNDGWLITGDAGFFDDKGHLVVLDRMKDLAHLAGGARYSPSYLENRLKASPYVGECIVVGEDREFLTAIICIRYSLVSKWAELRRIPFTTYQDLSLRPEVKALIASEIATINAVLPKNTRIRKIVLLYKEFDADDGELTRTRKIRRGVINTRYADIIDAMYTDADAVRIDTEITLQDGRRQRIRTVLDIQNIAGDVPSEKVG